MIVAVSPTGTNPKRDRRSRVLLLAERVAWTSGFALLLIWAFVRAAGWVGTQDEIHRFATVRAAGRLDADPPNLSLWSPKRVQAWHATFSQKGPAPLALLRIPGIALEVPVLEGTDDWTLNRAVGHIADTPEPGAAGNSGIAGHRDGFFRALKDVHAGDTLELETQVGTELYRITRIWVVGPDDVSVLDSTPTRSITLVTCYPFYFIGSAPQRYIVRAESTGSARQSSN
jgi:sortase A